MKIPIDMNNFYLYSTPLFECSKVNNSTVLGNASSVEGSKEMIPAPDLVSFKLKLDLLVHLYSEVGRYLSYTMVFFIGN